MRLATGGRRRVGDPRVVAYRAVVVALATGGRRPSVSLVPARTAAPTGRAGVRRAVLPRVVVVVLATSVRQPIVWLLAARTETPSR